MLIPLVRRKDYNSIVTHIEFEFPAPMILLNKEINRFLLFAILTKKCKGCRRFFCIRFFWQKKDNLAKKNAGQCFSNESEATCKNSADLEEKNITQNVT